MKLMYTKQRKREWRISFLGKGGFLEMEERWE